jgi:hypothetical protein
MFNPMVDDKPKNQPDQVPPRKWKQAEALRAIEILKAADPEKWAEYVRQELNGAQIDMELARDIVLILMPEFKEDFDQTWKLLMKIRVNVNPKWENERSDDQ